jgi:hypothetical protein
VPTRLAQDGVGDPVGGHAVAAGLDLCGEGWEVGAAGRSSPARRAGWLGLVAPRGGEADAEVLDDGGEDSTVGPAGGLLG